MKLHTSLQRVVLVAFIAINASFYTNVYSQTGSAAPYCQCINTPTGVCGTYYIGIGAIRIKSGSTVLMNNVTDCTAQGTGTNEYTFFNNLAPPVLSPGQTYTWEAQPLAAMTTGYGNYLSIWIDWNNDGVLLDASPEWITSGGQMGPGSMLTGTFTVPATAVGNLRMRCRTMNSGTMSACGTINYGETEDYTVSTGYSNDIAINAINTSTAVPFPPGANTIVAQVTNAGGNAITSVNLNYTITPSTGAPSSGTATFSTTIAVGGTASIPIINYNFPAIGSATVSVSVATVNGTTDGNPVNNNASRLLGAGLNGTYTIGGVSPDFISVAQAAAQLTAGGTIGPVTFNIRPGTYTENVYIANIPGNVSTKPVVFQSENGNKNSVILQYSNVAATAISGTTSIGGTPTLRLNNADYISFKNFTIGAVNTTPQYGNAIELIGATGGTSGCDNVSFDNMVFSGVTSTSTFLGDVFFLSVNAGYHPNLAVTNCTFNGASIPFYHVFSGTTYPAGFNISNNTFNNFGAYAMRLEGTDGATVNGNTWGSTSTSLIAGVVFVNHNGLFNFRKNRVNLTINNGISDVQSGSRSATSQAVFANNFLKVTGANGMGLNAAGSTNVGIFHNSICNGTAGSAFSATSGTTLSVVNNIFCNDGTGAAFTGASGLTANYNDYFVSGPTLAIWNGVGQSSMASYKAASAQDLNSSNVVVNFANKAINDLSLTAVDVNLYGIGSTSNGTFNIGIRGTVGDDIFGNTRNRAEVFMGAHQLNPVITFNPPPPTSLTGCANQTLTISANAVVTFGAQLSYSWQRNGAPLLDGVNGVTGSSTNTLTITGAQPSLNGGDYVLRVTATGGADPLVSSIISVVVNAPIQINIQPASRVICLGNETSLAVVASGTILSYQWQKDGQAIAGATSPIFVLSNAGFQMSGRYRCVMTGTCGTATATSDDAVVYVASTTLIGRDPEVNGAAVGSTGYLNVEVNATAQIPGYSPQFQWYQGGNMLSDNGRLSGATTNQLTIRNMQAADITKNYTCVVTGVCGSQTSQQGGFYISQISIQSQPASQEVCSNSDASLMVSASSNIPNVQYSYVWMLNGTAIANNTTYSGATTNVLTIKKAGAAQAGDYTVKIIANPTGATLISNAATVSVISSPVIGTQPKSLTVCVGEKIQMSVAATGGTLSYQWKVGGATVPGATDAMVEVQAADLSMNGAKVTCVISNNCGTSTSDEAVVTVNSKPTITVGPSNSAVVIGSNFVLSVVATNGVSYQWKKDGASIPGATNASYTLSSFTTGMAGNYLCEVTNGCGTATSDIATLAVSGREEEAEAAGFALTNAVPTPTTERARIEFNVPSTTSARISLSDAYGREIAVIFDGVAVAGKNIATIDASNLVSGVYTYTLTSSTHTMSRTMVVSK